LYYIYPPHANALHIAAGHTSEGALLNLPTTPCLYGPLEPQVPSLPNSTNHRLKVFEIKIPQYHKKKKKKPFISFARLQRLMPVILAAWEAEIRIKVRGQPRKKVFKTPHLQNDQSKMD
jgi:hypothetical protein